MFESGNMEKAVGFQKSVWDQYRDRFPNPGDYLKCPLKTTEDGEGFTGAQMSQFAKRMMVLHPGTYFHSGIDRTCNPPKVFVRRREAGWEPSKKDEEEEKLEQADLPGVTEE